MSHRWTLLIYRLPSQPSRLRLSVWRKLQALGAVYVQDGVAALPSRDDLDENLRQVAADVVEYEGTAFVVPTELPGPDDERMRGLFRSAADRRFAEVETALRATLAALGDSSQLGDLEEAEQSLARERIAFLRAKRISYLGGDKEPEVERLLRELRERLDTTATLA